MSRRLLSMVGGLALVLAATAGSVLAQNTQTTTTVTTQRTETIQNRDGSWTVVQYPADKEVTVNLTPSNLPGATGAARVRRMGDHTMINLDLSGLNNVSGLNLYAVDPAGRVTSLGPVNINNGAVTQSFTTPLDKFMLVLSPESSLTSIAADTPVMFRSTVPTGFAVIPRAHSGSQGGAPVGERVAATAAPTATAAYNVPMLGIPNFRRGTDTHMRVNFPSLRGLRANVFLEPRHDGPTTIKMRFHSMKRAPAGKRLVAWLVSPDNKFVKLGEVVNTGGRNEAQIQGETDLQDFGIFVTAEEASDLTSPAGQVVGTIITNTR